MTQDWPFLDAPVRPVALILERLHESWPEPITLTPSHLGIEGEDRAFLLAFVALQDAGWVMCETLLAGAGREPCALGTMLTARGRNEYVRPRPAG